MNYYSAILSNHNYLVDETISTIGRTFPHRSKQFEQLPIKYTDFTHDTETRTQNLLNQLNMKQYHAIIIIVRFDRTDLMQREIQSFALHLSKYKKNIVILVKGFQNSEDKVDDLASIKKLLQDLQLKGIIEDEKSRIQQELASLVQDLNSVQINLTNYFGEYNEEYFQQQLNQALVIKRYEDSSSQSIDQNLNQNHTNIDQHPDYNISWYWIWWTIILIAFKKCICFWL